MNFSDSVRRRIFWLAIVIILSPALAFFYLQPAPLPVDSLLRLADRYEVRILRDTYGVPHVFGKTDADAAFGLAYAHAEDDFQTIQNVLLASRGRLAAVYGKEMAANDYMVGLLRIQEVAEQQYRDALSPETRALCQAYADGINFYAAEHPGLAVDNLYPLHGQDIVAGFLHKMPLFLGLDRVLRELFAPERQRPLTAEPDSSQDDGIVAAEQATEPVFPRVLRFTAGETADSSTPVGSNAFAVAPQRSADGATRLAINSHQPWTGPVAWYEAHIKSEQGLDITGGLFPGSPVILHGHNRHLGWAHTVNKPDLIDVYVLETNPENENQYRLDGTWRDLEVRKLPIRIKLIGPFYWTVEREVLWSVHGPVVRQPHGTYAIRIAGYGDGRQIEQWYRMNKAKDFEEWQAAMRMHSLPMFNTIYADAAGTIYYVYNALLPERTAGYRWRDYLPGNTSRTLWDSYLHFDRLPQVKKPPSGFVQNCNSSPFQTTTGSGNPSAEDFASDFGIETHMTNRALRAHELYGADTSITAAEFEAYKFDTAYSPASMMAKMVKQVQLARDGADSLTRAALDHLAKWDLHTTTGNRQAALAVLSFSQFFSANPDTLQPATLQNALRETAAMLLEKHGQLEVKWGDLNRLKRGRVTLPLAGAPDVLRAIYHRREPDGRLQAIAGDSFILLAEWDPSGRLTSKSLHQFGSATLDSASAHFADQAPLFARHRLKPVWLDKDSIRAHLEEEYRPGRRTSHRMNSAR